MAQGQCLSRIQVSAWSSTPRCGASRWVSGLPDTLHALRECVNLQLTASLKLAQGDSTPYSHDHIQPVPVLGEPHMSHLSEVFSLNPHMPAAG